MLFADLHPQSGALMVPRHSSSAEEEFLGKYRTFGPETTTSLGFYRWSVTPSFFGHIAFFDKFISPVKKKLNKTSVLEFFSHFSASPARSNSAHFEL